MKAKVGEYLEIVSHCKNALRILFDGYTKSDLYGGLSSSQ